MNWIKVNQPDIWQQTDKFLLLSGYLNYRLCGRFIDSAGSQVAYEPFDCKFGVPAARPHIYETSALGAAMDAAVGLRLHPDFASQAPFHMGFFHEADMVYKAAGFLRRTYPEYRIHLWQSLAAYALHTAHPYWGRRFAGWALHYIEDLTQP